MEPFRRTVALRTTDAPAGGRRSVARTDDFFHGFEVTLRVVGDEVVSAGATAHRHPWTTCPGALDAVAAISGPLPTVKRQVLAAPRSTTCVHVNDLVNLAARCHADRTYEIECEPTWVRLERDGDAVFDLPIDDWVIAGSGPYSGFGMNDLRWGEVLRGRDDDQHEAVLMLRRGLLVAMGVHLLDWNRVSRGHHIEYGVMAGSCHTFSEPQVSEAVSLVDPPR